MSATTGLDTDLGESLVDEPEFDTISLDELLADSALLNRVDRKHLVPADDLPEISHRLAGDARVLEIDDRTWFDYRSTYFDTPDLVSYASAGHGRRRRFKVRTRDYVTSQTGFLEVKTRGGRGTTVKDRLPHRFGDAELNRYEQCWIGDTLARRGVDPAPSQALIPTLVTGYRRRTLRIQPRDDRVTSRVTIDIALTWELPARAPGGPLSMGLDRFAIVETKGAPRPSHVDRMLWRLGHRPTSISKYGVGVAILRLDQPPLKWRTLLARRLAD